jgi:UDP-hydrolysing UDP-N-acetyl-D-glucosamine 2-epimerase
MIARIPIAHLHGGEASEGAIDEAIRHSITKMSHLHFTASDEYSKKVIQLGEQPARVWNVGATGLDNISKLKKVPKNQIEEHLGIKLKKPIFLITYHPATLNKKNQANKLKLILSTLDKFDGTNIITGINADSGNKKLKKVCIEFCSRRSKNSVFFDSLGSHLYLNLMRISDVVIGNSSSGIIEAPFIGTPTINIGDRQKGRSMAPSIICCDEEYDSIFSALKLSLSKKHLEVTKRKDSPYGKPGAAKKIINILSKTSFDNLIKKKFHLIDVEAFKKNY